MTYWTNWRDDFGLVHSESAKVRRRRSLLFKTGGGTLWVPLRFTLEIDGLGTDPWVSAVSLGLPSSIGVVAADPNGIDFSTFTKFDADDGSGFVPLVPPAIRPTGGATAAIYTWSIFVVRPVPAPSTRVLSALAICGLLAFR